MQMHSRCNDNILLLFTTSNIFELLNKHIFLNGMYFKKQKVKKKKKKKKIYIYIDNCIYLFIFNKIIKKIIYIFF